MSPRTGRPKSDNSKDIMLRVRIDDETIKKLNYIAFKQGSNKSNIIRSGITELYNSLIQEEINMNEKKFIEDNLKKKDELLQKEHKQIMHIIYNDLCELRKSIANMDEEKAKYIIHYVTYSKLIKMTNTIMSTIVLQICLRDLENMGFIVKTNPVRIEYEICPLGLEYIKYYGNEKEFSELQYKYDY